MAAPQHNVEEFAMLPDNGSAFIPLLDGAAEPDARSAAPRVQRALAAMCFSDGMLMRHLHDAELGEALITPALDVVRRRPDMDLAQPFRDLAAYERQRYVSTTFEVYEVAHNATPRKLSRDVDSLPAESLDGIVDAPTVWEAIKHVNADGQAVGRITIVQEPSPLILAALHLTMSPRFDMSELLGHLLSEVPNRGRTHAFMHRAYERGQSEAYQPPPLDDDDEPAAAVAPAVSAPLPSSSPFAYLRQRSFFFVFKYYTVVGEGLDHPPWQRFDKRSVNERPGDHIDITECSSILALSLGGEPTKLLRMRFRLERAREGFLFDTFGPSHPLGITVRGDDFQHKSFCNGPYAFLDLLWRLQLPRSSQPGSALPSHRALTEITDMINGRKREGFISRKTTENGDFWPISG
ncbi:hypothetical protein HIM_07936 [Hirsutella minnesotensis 3608]|uniref:Uncharacterized protein n=1 Tax=Hirsutella minnesotensis 3608 TaxID=1043627 RepID=A0A0F8A406_9HYPO|nr:hypothetical protein HIM_07936 [Hirsutella minnesotensis 3608]